MEDYKVAKEAFHAGGAGSSLWNINAVSLVALTSYAAYAGLARHCKPWVPLDYVSMVLPLLLGVTVHAKRSLALNVVMTIATILLFATSSNRRRGESDQIGAASSSPRQQRRTQGQWLDESDSDEEPSEPAPQSASLSIPSSAPISATSSGISIATSPVPSPSALMPESPLDDAKPRKRRHSPTPSTHTHTAIDILPTPETLPNGTMSSQQASYPSPTAAAAKLKQLSARLPFLSVYRAHMMIMTIHCILAVDFPIFPRAFGKCEDFGTSLMDVGVGSFVFSLGIVSTKMYAAGPGQKPLYKIMRSLYKSLPIILLGLVRVVTVKGTEYPEHVTEYGVHWNFFFTLAVMPVLGTMVAPMRQSVMRWSGIGLLITLVHEIALHKAGLMTWVLRPERIGLIGMNKEGLVSLPGYLAIYCFGLATGDRISRATAPLKTSRPVNGTYEEHLRAHLAKRRTELALELFSYSFGWWVATALARFIGLQVSRRLANMTYVLWVSAYNTTFLFGYLAIELIFFSGRTEQAVPPLLEAINANGLAVFLVANLLTGLVNVSMQTMYADGRTSQVVLLAYSVAVCSLAWLGRSYRLKLG